MYKGINMKKINLKEVTVKEIEKLFKHTNLKYVRIDQPYLIVS